MSSSLKQLLSATPWRIVKRRPEGLVAQLRSPGVRSSAKNVDQGDGEPRVGERVQERESLDPLGVL